MTDGDRPGSSELQAPAGVYSTGDAGPVDCEIKSNRSYNVVPEVSLARYSNPSSSAYQRTRAPEVAVAVCLMRSQYETCEGRQSRAAQTSS